MGLGVGNPALREAKTVDRKAACGRACAGSGSETPPFVEARRFELVGLMRRASEISWLGPQCEGSST